MLLLRVAAGLVFVGMTLEAQPASTLRFEVAAIKPTPAERWNGSSGGTTGKGKLTMQNRTLKRYIMGAYGVGPNQIVGGPSWLDLNRFDIQAKAELPTDDDEVIMGMLQTLLAERFKLALHRESKPGQAYVLEVAKDGPKIGKALDSEDTTNTRRGEIDAHAITMKRFAEVLSRELDLPVVNETGLEGAFNLKLHWSPEAERAPDSGPTIFTAIQQFGLRLRPRKTSVEMLIIDHVEMPTEN